MSRKHALVETMLTLLILAGGSAGKAKADTPLEPISETTFCSKDGRYCAHSTASPAHLDVFLKRDPEHVLWSRNEYVIKGFVSNDGKAVLSCYGGLNLIPLDATLEFLLARVLHASGNVEEIRLRSLYTDIHQLPHTDSHLEWGRCVGIDSGKVLLERPDGSQWHSSEL